MGDFSFPELLVIVVIAILIYGKDLPLAARKLAQLYGKFRRHLGDIKDELRRQIPPEELRVDIPDPVPSPEAPPPPYNVTAVAEGTHVRLAWERIEGATGYSLRRTASEEEPYTLLAQNVAEPSYLDAAVTDGSTYRYVVSSVNAAGESGNSDEAVVTLPAAPPGGNGSPPPPPADVTPSLD